MFCVSIDKPHEWEEAHVYTLSDLHLGDVHCNEHEIAEQIKRITEDCSALVVLNGDIMNTAIRTSISDVYTEKLSPMQQIEAAVKMLKPIKDKIIGATCGNHEARIYRTDGVDTMRLVCRELGCEDKYHPDGVLIFIQFGVAKSHKNRADKPLYKQIYTIYATHGTGGGRKEGAKAIRLADMASIVGADVYIHSHTHLPMVMKNMCYRADTQNKSARPVERLFVNTGASLDYGGYGQVNEYKPTSHQTPVIILSGKKHFAQATM